MSRLRAEFLYEVGHLWLCAEALGASATFDRDGLQVEIAMPRERTQFSDRVRNDDWFWVALTGTTAGSLHGPDEFFEIRLIGVLVRGDSPVSSDDFPPEGSVGNAALRAFEFFRRAQAVADSALADFIDWARVWGEPWLGLHRQVPPQVGTQLIFDDERNKPLPIGQVQPYLGRDHPIVGLTSEDFSHLAKHLGAREEPALADVLLADAVFLSSEAHCDPGRAVLTAAIALEVRVKEVLRNAASPEAARIVDLILENPRDWPQPAAALFDKAMVAVTGRSLRLEQREIYKTIDHLFQARNAVAHSGKLPSEREAREFAEIARVAFTWLGSVELDAHRDHTDTAQKSGH